MLGFGLRILYMILLFRKLKRGMEQFDGRGKVRVIEDKLH